MQKARRPICSAAMMVVPDPAKASRTIDPRREQSASRQRQPSPARCFARRGDERIKQTRQPARVPLSDRSPYAVSQ